MRIVSKPSVVANIWAIILFLFLNFGLIVFFGGNFPFASGLVPLTTSMILIISLAIPSNLGANSLSKPLLALVFVPIVLCLAFAAVQAIQVPSLAFIANPAWQILPTAGFSAISINPSVTITYWVYATGLLLFSLAVLRMAQVQPTTLVRIIASLITLAALYGIIVFAQGNHAVLWLPKTSYYDDLSATFINRNSFATLAGLGVLANLALALQRVGEISSRLSTSQRLRAFWLLVLKPGWPWLGMAVVCFLALVLTNSRAGFVSTAVGTVIFLASLCIARPPARIPLLAIIGTLTVASLLVLSAVGGTLGARLNQAQSDVGARQSIFALSRDVITQYPYTGTGFGTYAQAYNTASQPEQLSKVYALVEHAHNTYYELATELGIPSTLLLAISAFAALSILIHGLRTRRRAIVWPALGVSTMVLVGGHALADFSLSIPAVAVVAITFIMTGIAQSLAARKDDEPARPTLTTKILPYVYGAVAVVVLVASSWQSVANYHAMRAGSTIKAISTVPRNIAVPVLLKARQHLETCLRINPWHPTCGFSLGQTDLTLAATIGLRENSPGRGLALVYLNMARNRYQLALESDPSNSNGWYRLATINDYLGYKNDAITALTNSVLVGPAEATVSKIRIPMMLSYLPGLTPEDANLYRDNILRIWRASVWDLAPILRATPSTLPVMAEIIKNDPPSIERWKNNIGTPLPAATPVAESPENR